MPLENQIDPVPGAAGAMDENAKREEGRENDARSARQQVVAPSLAPVAFDDERQVPKLETGSGTALAIMPEEGDALVALLADQYPQLPENLTLKAACQGVRQLVAEVIGLVSDRVMMRRDRRHLVSHGRQISIYVCHVVLQMLQRDIADGFGCTRSTVSHACHIVEDRRDDPAFDEFVSGIERMVGGVFGIPDYVPARSRLALLKEREAAHD